ncbi:MAG: NPCBM/NEW2 domain-containing protein [Phycisphaerae bacterium]|nr:NPCBM/NEW2 domain-containing protein [Tepidisphaeraceae bacterium]
MSLRSFLACFVPFLTLVVQPSRANDIWTLTTADFKSRPASLFSISDAGVTLQFANATEPAIVPWEKFLQLDRGGSTAQPKGAWTLHLATGDRLGGEPVSLANDSLTWRSPAAGELAIPLKEVRAFVRGQDPLGAAATADRTEDAVLLSNGDNVKGILTGIDAGKLVIKQASGDAIPVDLSAASKVLLAAAGKPESTGKRSFRVILSDGSALSAPVVALADDAKQLTLTLAGGDKRTLDLAQITRIEQLNGPVSWLSARVPDQSVYHPMLDVGYPPQMDRNYRGDRIRANNRDYARGIGVHAYAKLTWSLDPAEGFKVLRTQYALNDDVTKGRVTVRILLDDKVVHEAKDFAPGKISPVILIDLGSAKTLSLEAHPGGDPTTDDRTKWAIDTQARLNWLEPALLKEKPAPDPAPKVETPKVDPVAPKPEVPKTETPKSETPKPQTEPKEPTKPEAPKAEPAPKPSVE